MKYKTINLKRKLIECLIYEIYEKYQDFLMFTPDYFPRTNCLEALFKLMENALKKYEQKNKIKECDKCSESGLCEHCNELNKSKIAEIKSDIKELENIQKNNKEKNPDCKIFIKKNFIKFGELKIVLDFLRFYKKILNPFAHAEGESINYYLLTNNLFAPKIKKENILFSLNDIIETKDIAKNNKKYDELEKLNLNHDFYIYIPEKKISIDEAIKILINPEQFYIDEKLYSEKLKKIKIKLEQDLSNFNDYYNVFLKDNISVIIDDSADKNIDFTKIESEEKDLYELLNNYKKDLEKILKNDIKKEKASEIIESLYLTIKEEINKAREFVDNIGKFYRTLDQIKNPLISRLNRIYLIRRFVNEQNEKFIDRQKQIFNEINDSAKQILKKSESLKYLIEKNSFTNILKKWLESDLDYDYDVESLNENSMKTNIQNLIQSVRLYLNYTFDERFVLWMNKNKFFKCLKNDF